MFKPQQVKSRQHEALNFHFSPVLQLLTSRWTPGMMIGRRVEGQKGGKGKEGVYLRGRGDVSKVKGHLQ